jgi:hypothetical protein
MKEGPSMKKHLCVLVLTFGSIAVLLTGCASVVVPQPAQITIQEAMKQVGEGLKSMKEAQGGLRTGLVPDELEVTFNVTASGEQGGKLTLEATPIVTVPNIGGKAELSNAYTAKRSNQITLKLKNIMYADPSKILAKDPGALRELLEIINDPQYGDTVKGVTGQ